MATNQVVSQKLDFFMQSFLHDEKVLPPTPTEFRGDYPFAGPNRGTAWGEIAGKLRCKCGAWPAVTLIEDAH